ncbi:hypothetical protein OQA88_3700 [Cercophora sp. LCS_1]
MGSTVEGIPYWHVNVPEDQRSAECPDYLREVTPKDLGIISTPDSQYHRDTWEEAKKKVADNTIHLFQRVPSELRRYKAFIWDLKRQYDGVLNYILSQRLGWPSPIVPRGKPFEYEDDVKILWNDWPYGIDDRIVHLVVWTKFGLEEDPATGDLTDEARAEISAYVREKFSEIPDDRIIWFKNWQSLKSVKAVEHFHVMMYDPDPEFVNKITNGDVPAFIKAGGLSSACT